MARRKSKKNSPKPGLSGDSKFGISLSGIMVEDEVAAINDYFIRTEANTYKAETLQEAWHDWYRDLGWSDFYLDGDDTVNIARARRFDFNEANQTPEPQRPREVAIDGMGVIADQYSPEAQRAALVDEVPEEPWIPTKYKVALFIGGGVVAGLYVLRAAAPFIQGAINPLSLLIPKAK